MLPITKKFTYCTISNRGGVKPEWIVMHYFGALCTAEECAAWFCNPENDQGSADFCVDDENIIQVNPDILKYNTWHCGGKLQGSIHHEYHGICKNNNSIGIEMRPYNDDGSVQDAQNAGWYFHDKTVQNAVDLVKYLMKKYDIDADHVIMHTNVTGKYCPAPWIDRPEEWEAFQKAIRSEETVVQKPSVPLYRVQAGAFSKKTGANAHLKAIKAAGFDAFLVQIDGLWKVQVGAFKNRSGAEVWLEKITSAGFDAFITTNGQIVETPVVKKIDIGSTVKVKTGAKTFNGGNLATFVYERNHKVKEINVDRVVITYDGVVVAAVRKSDLILVD